MSSIKRKCEGKMVKLGKNCEKERGIAFDLLGNTVVVPVIEAVAKRVLDIYYEKGNKK